MKKLLAAFGITTVIFSSAFASAQEALNFNNFEAGVTSILQDGGSSVSGMIRYAPQYQLNETMIVGASIDYAPHKFNDESKFSATNILINGEYTLTSEWALGASVGIETWDCSGCKAETVVGVLARYALPYDLYGVQIKSLFIQALAISTDPAATGIIAGPQFSF